MELNCKKGQNTVWQDNVVETQGVFLYNWHVQIIEAPSFSPFCVTFAKINSVPRYIDQEKKFDSCCFVGTLSSWALVTLSVRPPIRSSPPYTFSPGTSFSRASFPRAWSLINENEISSLLLHRGSAVVFCYLRVMAAKRSHQWWCVVRTAVRNKPSLFTISSSCQKNQQQMSSVSQQIHQENWLSWINE